MLPAMKDPRKGLIAKIHIAKSQLAMEEESYRAMLARITGKESCAAMDTRQLEAVLKEFQRLGFKKRPPTRSGGRKQAAHPQARKIRALWLTLKNLGELRDASEDALGAFVKRATGVDDLSWITPKDANTVINALKGWIKRVEDKEAE